MKTLSKWRAARAAAAKAASRRVYAARNPYSAQTECDRLKDRGHNPVVKLEDDQWVVFSD